MDNVLFLETVDSTNRVARDFAGMGVPHGYAVVAGRQTAGRGRLGKLWQSPAGHGLYCTIVLRPCLDTRDYAKITLIAGLAVTFVLEEICDLNIELKWPNDIYIAGRKCGGILVETSSLQDNAAQHFVLVGIGLNVNGDLAAFPGTLQRTATSLFIETGKEQDVLIILGKIRTRLLQLLSQLVQEGFAGMLEQWRKRDMLEGKWMSWLTPVGDVVYGESLGVDNSGILMIRDREGRIHEVLSGDLSLDPRSPEGG